MNIQQKPCLTWADASAHGMDTDTYIRGFIQWRFERDYRALNSPSTLRKRLLGTDMFGRVEFGLEAAQ